MSELFLMSFTRFEITELSPAHIFALIADEATGKSHLIHTFDGKIENFTSGSKGSMERLEGQKKAKVIADGWLERTKGNRAFKLHTPYSIESLKMIVWGDREIERILNVLDRATKASTKHETATLKVAASNGKHYEKWGEWA